MTRAAALLLLACALAQGQARKCGTAALQAAPVDRRGSAPRPAPPPSGIALPAARILATDHFAIRYCLAGPDQVRLTDGDARLVSLRDSLYRALGGTPGNSGDDRAVLDRLDAAGAPHALYAVTAARFFEEARRAYVDGMGMRAPRMTQSSPYWRAPPGADGRYAVDIADVDRVWPDFAGQAIYAYAFDFDGRSGIALENDFLFDATLGPDGRPRGRPIVSVVDRKVFRDYSVEWEAGLAATCAHELYHAVQFAHTPGRPPPYHVWYETSATAMEERMAPEVDDWLQYIQPLYDDLPRLGMFDYPGSRANSQYGNAAYHHFLAGALGPGFDKALWERLAGNGNDLADALEASLRGGGLDPGESHVRYAARLAYGGSPIKGPYPPMTPDQARWPVLWKAPVDLGRGAPEIGVLPPLSVRPIAFTGLRAGGGSRALFLRDTALRAVVLRVRGDSALPEFPAAGVIPLDPGPSGPDLLYVMVVNGSLHRHGRADIAPFSSRADTLVYAYPNPVSRASGTAFFSRVPGGAAVSLWSEDGRRLRDLAFAADAAVWAWNLEAGEDGKGRKVRPGVYYYRVGGGALRPLYVRE